MLHASYQQILSAIPSEYSQNQTTLLVLDHHHLSLRFTVTEQVRGHPLSTLVCPTPACPLICYSELFKTEIKSHHSSIKTSHGSILLQSKNQSPPNGFQGLNDLGPPLCLWNLTSSTHSLTDSAPAIPVLCFNMARCSCLGPWHWLFFLVQMFCAGTCMVYSLIWFWSLLRYYFIGNDFCDQPRKKNFPAFPLHCFIFIRTTNWSWYKYAYSVSIPTKTDVP